ncbi:hypothetical protein DPMN_008237 [Dreissena polymorpha]|uniref:Uncharacterized protein n=1 Tax=Dreissena polymorpha TaxID=45954 RepID=A0A9D4MXZ4_DREPO|nr:hypothetical protein DPMN_008237 [Dreissena polymorpha]
MSEVFISARRLYRRATHSHTSTLGLKHRHTVVRMSLRNRYIERPPPQRGPPPREVSPYFKGGGEVPSHQIWRSR